MTYPNQDLCPCLRLPRKDSRAGGLESGLKSRKPAGHRRWGKAGQAVPGTHQGDIMSTATRSVVMSRIKSKGTKPEEQIRSRLLLANLSFEQHCNDLPGTPDFIFREEKVALFVDGDFWHGWRFPLWRHKLSPKWQKKIEKTRDRDRTNFRRLRRMGWRVVRIWEHQIDTDVENCLLRIQKLLSG